MIKVKHKMISFFKYWRPSNPLRWLTAIFLFCEFHYSMKTLLNFLRFTRFNVNTTEVPQKINKKINKYSMWRKKVRSWCPLSLPVLMSFVTTYKTLDSDPNQAAITNNFLSTIKFKKSNHVKVPAKNEV